MAMAPQAMAAHSPTMLSVGLLLLVGLVPEVTSRDDLRVAELAPRLDDRVAPPPPSQFDVMRKRGRLLAGVRRETYDERLEPHPLIEEAAAILVEELRPHARAVYLTSLSRAPEDQRHLMRTRRYRGWAIERSKHLLGGFAADIGFVRPRMHMWKMRDVAAQILADRLGPERSPLVRVVAESRCIHIEIDSFHGREDIEARANSLHRWGIITNPPDELNPVPPLRDYVSEDAWAKRPRQPLTAEPG